NPGAPDLVGPLDLHPVVAVARVVAKHDEALAALIDKGPERPVLVVPVPFPLQPGNRPYHSQTESVMVHEHRVQFFRCGRQDHPGQYPRTPEAASRAMVIERVGPARLTLGAECLEGVEAAAEAAPLALHASRHPAAVVEEVAVEVPLSARLQRAQLARHVSGPVPDRHAGPVQPLARGDAATG